ncbi:S8 family serine peptidase [Catenulispora sp. GP43]|uniref:S8 family serine peptidase n=1 Tax=Catenulispora sp. GP43 TaxID=3156263 RepID=UPI0035140FAA
MSHRLGLLMGVCGMAALAFMPPTVRADDAVPKPASQWPLTYLKADQVWQLTKGAGVTVGLVDSGVTPLGDTRDNLLPGADFSLGPDSTGIAHVDTDTDSHGTTMAVLIAGTGAGDGLHGLAPEAKILPVRMQQATGSDPVHIADAVKFAVAQHVKVINMSLGTADTPGMAAAVKQAEAADIVVVAAAGNYGTQHVIIPAAYPGVVAAGAIDDSGARWSGSSYGPQVALTAPGVGIPVEDANGVPKTTKGTSEASAYVTASVALVRAMHPDWTAGQTIRALLASATKAGGATGLQRNNAYGYGIVNPLGALSVGAPVAKDNPLLPGTAPLAASLPAAAPTSAAPASTTSSAATSASPATSTPGHMTTAALKNSTKAAAATKSGLLSSRRDKVLAACAGAAVLGLLLLALNGSLKRRAQRKNRVWH